MTRTPLEIAASMRPRPMTAENGHDDPGRAPPDRRFNEAAADDRGKRDGVHLGAIVEQGFNEAAADDRGKPGSRAQPEDARPRFNEAAADDRGKPFRFRGLRGAGSVASMRPRPMTAENTPPQRQTAPLVTRFNEAAADDRGKPPGRRGQGAGRRASMRPRPMTAENSSPTRGTTRRIAGFNEAAADDRGKPATRRPPRRR